MIFKAMTMNINSNLWDVLVIGGGPSGMIAAGRAAERDKTILLLEKNLTLGKKLLISGGGRCNLTNYKPNMNSLISCYKNKPKALFSAYSKFGVEDTLDFFHSRGMKTKVEEHDRVFPVSDKAQSVWDALVQYMEEGGVKIKRNANVKSISFDKSKKVFTIKTSRSVHQAKSCIITTGGTSHPETGSTGDGFSWMKKLGHTIVQDDMSLVPVAIKDAWCKRLSGVTLEDIDISLWQDNKKHHSSRGRLLFTHVGVSGPTILNMSSKVRDLLKNGEVKIQLDLFPDLNETQLKQELYNLLEQESNKKIKNSIYKLAPKRLVPAILVQAQVDGETFNHSVTKVERNNLLKTMKGKALYVKGLLGPEKAIVSSGGVLIDEINFQTMMSKIIPNLYIIGDMLSIDRPSGGYSLQICWSTGYVAGDNC